MEEEEEKEEEEESENEYKKGKGNDKDKDKNENIIINEEKTRYLITYIAKTIKKKAIKTTVIISITTKTAKQKTFIHKKKTEKTHTRVRGSTLAFRVSLRTYLLKVYSALLPHMSPSFPYN